MTYDDWKADVANRDGSAPDEPACICDFEDECDGSGTLQCIGCGGDQCVCAACWGNGAADCDGCDNCIGPDEGDDGYDSDYEDRL